MYSKDIVWYAYVGISVEISFRKQISDTKTQAMKKAEKLSPILRIQISHDIVLITKCVVKTLIHFMGSIVVVAF